MPDSTVKPRTLRPVLHGLALLLGLASPAFALFGADAPALWQERFFWDALLSGRSRLARSQADPAQIPVLKAIAGQTAQQVANLSQIHAYVKAQQDNLAYAFGQPDPGPSLDTIQANFETLAKGAEQVRNNLYYLTARCRMASTQALPDPEASSASLLILGQIQQLQLRLNALYLDTVTVRGKVHENKWAADKFFIFRTESLFRNVVRVQDSIFTAYNSALELHLRSR
ncbi:MAG: hypothetical protein HZB91_03470 [Elusimicrobia bacterium]|nr:hypothetical protein [Elusimicrobiota bacterium]MBI5882147.1 hypothetical protein [Elusimicrobiota bacterium]